MLYTYILSMPDGLTAVKPGSAVFSYNTRTAFMYYQFFFANPKQNTLVGMQWIYILKIKKNDIYMATCSPYVSPKGRKYQNLSCFYFKLSLITLTQSLAPHCSCLSLCGLCGGITFAHSKTDNMMSIFNVISHNLKCLISHIELSTFCGSVCGRQVWTQGLENIPVRCQHWPCHYYNSFPSFIGLINSPGFFQIWENYFRTLCISSMSFTEQQSLTNYGWNC